MKKVITRRAASIAVEEEPKRGVANRREAPPPQDPLATPFEVAQLAVALASLNGEEKPNLDAAISLLRDAAIRVQDEKRPVKRFIHSAWYATKEEADAHQWPSRCGHDKRTVVMCPETHPDEFVEYVAQIKREHPSLAKVEPPKRFPALLPAVMESLLFKRDKKSGTRLLNRFIKADPKKFNLVQFPVQNVFSFWFTAKLFAPYLKRNTTRKKPAKRNAAGQFK